MTLPEIIEKAEGVRDDAFLEPGIIIRNQDNMMLESVPFSVRDIMEGYAPDILLKRDDLVRISSIFDLRETFTIGVSGAVNNPNRYEYLEGMTLEDAVYVANGLRDEAGAYRVEVARRVVDSDVRSKVCINVEVYEFEIDEHSSFKWGVGLFRLR